MLAEDEMNEILLHNYPQSPYAEKVRVCFGIKDLAWRSVEIPRLPPKPMLTTLTGGYRRTPVMQIGADIYCDTLCILSELERRWPTPSFFPNEPGAALGLSRWTDGAFFTQCVKLILGAAGASAPPGFAEDRGRLYLGPNWAEGLRQAGAELPHIAAQIRAQFGWADQQFADGRRFLLGDAPGMADAQVYHLIWFIRGRWSGGPALLSEFPALEAWEKRVEAIGHGARSEMPAEEAIRIAAEAAPRTPERADPLDPQGLRPGAAIRVEPDVDGGEQPVEGVARLIERDRIAILRVSEDAGEVCVHFPRAGYRVTPI